MKTKVLDDAYLRVEAVNSSFYYYPKKDPKILDLEDIQRQIKRHVDGASTVLIVKYKDICSYCNYDWEESDGSDEPLGLPQCCSKAQEDWVNESTKTA